MLIISMKEFINSIVYYCHKVNLLLLTYILFYRRIGVVDNTINKDSNFMNSAEREIYDRLQKLKEDKQIEQNISNDDITTRLKNLKGEVPSTSDAELTAKLANLKGVPISAVQSKVIFSFSNI